MLERTKEPQRIDAVAAETKRLVGRIPKRTPSEAYEAGRDAGRNGPNTWNAHFSFFATERLRDSWQKGEKQGKLERAELAEHVEGDRDRPEDER